LQAVCQLTGLRQLYVFGSERMEEGSFLQLTQLKQLTKLHCSTLDADGLPLAEEVDLTGVVYCRTPTPTLTQKG
jgi:L-arabinose isomerase